MAGEEGLEPSNTVLETAVFPIRLLSHVASGAGVEPTLTESKSVVLPLHNPEMGIPRIRNPKECHSHTNIPLLNFPWYF